MKHVDQVVDAAWYLNSLRQWVTAGLILVVGLAALLVVRHLVGDRLRPGGKRRRSTELRALVGDLVRNTTAIFLFVLCLEAALRWLQVPAGFETLSERALWLVVLFQIAVWGTGIIGFWVRRYVGNRRAAADVVSATTITALGYAGRFVLWALILATALENTGVHITGLVTSLGIGGIALALAVQNVLGDLLAALAIVFDKPFDVGDVIVVDTMQGKVEHVGLKTTRIRSPSGEQIIVSNSELLKGRIRNFKRMVERRVVFTTDLSYDTPADVVARVPEMLREIVTANTPVRFDRSHFATFTDAALRVETVYFVLDPDYARYMDIQQAVNLEVLRRFRAERITLAAPIAAAVRPPAPGAPPS